MLGVVCLTVASAMYQQARPYSFLSYQDTIFAVRTREGWIKPRSTTEVPHGTIRLQEIGLRASKKFEDGFPGTWDSAAACWTVACEDFQHLMGWSVDPHFVRSLSKRPDLQEKVIQQAKDLMLKHSLSFKGFKDVQVFSTDLAGDGHQEVLAELTAVAEYHSYGMVFMLLDNQKRKELAFCRDGWPKLLSVVAFDDDLSMNVFVGGTTSTGRIIKMYGFQKGELIKMPSYQSP